MLGTPFARFRSVVLSFSLSSMYFLSLLDRLLIIITIRIGFGLISLITTKLFIYFFVHFVVVVVKKEPSSFIQREFEFPKLLQQEKRPNSLEIT